MDPMLGNAKKASNGERERALGCVISALPPTEEGEGDCRLASVLYQSNGSNDEAQNNEAPVNPWNPECAHTSLADSLHPDALSWVYPEAWKVCV